MMNKKTRRSFLKMFVSGIVGFGLIPFFSKKDYSTRDRPLKEADFYKKHDSAG